MGVGGGAGSAHSSDLCSAALLCVSWRCNPACAFHGIKVGEVDESVRGGGDASSSGLLEVPAASCAVAPIVLARGVFVE